MPSEAIRARRESIDRRDAQLRPCFFGSVGPESRGPFVDRRADELAERSASRRSTVRRELRGKSRLSPVAPRPLPVPHFLRVLWTGVPRVGMTRRIRCHRTVRDGEPERRVGNDVSARCTKRLPRTVALRETSRNELRRASAPHAATRTGPGRRSPRGGCTRRRFHQAGCASGRGARTALGRWSRRPDRSPSRSPRLD